MSTRHSAVFGLGLQATFKKFDVDSPMLCRQREDLVLRFRLHHCVQPERGRSCDIRSVSHGLQVLGDTFEGEQVEKLLAEADILKD